MRYEDKKSYDQVTHSLGERSLAGGPKMGSDEDIFKMVEGALAAGAEGVSIGRNAFQHKNPTKMVQALSKMVHKGASVDEAMKTLV